MTKFQLIQKSFLQALGILVYVTLVAWLPTNRFGESLPQNILTPITILLLLVVSVAIVGMLMFAKPVTLYLDGQKTEAIRLAVYTVLWLAAFTFVFLIVVSRFHH